MATEIKLYRGSAAQFASENPILADGELGVELDTQLILIGDGVTHANALAPPFVQGSALVAPGDLVVATAAGVPGRLGKGYYGQRLNVSSDGSLNWVDNLLNTAGLVSSDYAQSTYEPKATATAVHASLETASDASATYKTIAQANADHAAFMTQDTFYTTYQTIYAVDAIKETKWYYAWKTASTSRASTVVQTADPDLHFPIVAGGTYIFEANLYVQGTTVTDFALNGTSANVSAWHMGVQGLTTSVASGSDTAQAIIRLVGSATDESASVSLGMSDAYPEYISVKGSLTCSTTGVWSLLWSQGTSSASALVMLAGSHIKALRVA